MNEDKAEDLTSVLRNLGYKKVEAQRRAEAVLEQHPDAVVPLELLIKEALAWAHPPGGVMKAQQVLTQEQAVDEPVGDVSKPEPLVTARFHWEATTEAPELEVSSGKGWLITLATIAVLAGVVTWFGVVRSLMVLAGVIVFFYFLGKTVGKNEA